MLSLPNPVGNVPVADVLAMEALPAGAGDVVYLAGSHAEGLANPWSDVDVFVITDRHPVGPFARDGGVNRVSQHYVDGLRFDFEFWRPTDVEALARRVAAFVPGRGDYLTGALFQHIEECFIHRLRTGRPLVNPDAFARCQSLFDFERFRAFKVEDTIRHLDALLDDVCGMAEAADRDPALFMARAVIETAVDAYCHSLGSTDPVRKWRARHLARLAPGDAHGAEVETAFWRLQFPDAARLRADAGAWRDHLEECIRFANRVVAWIQR